ncbi:oxidoreductase [Sphaerisporangium krabiense]|uniref:Putative dehydrogenase n=1 Tax=Sphaerisporangium krabiense TaxID=763782 RepID=A0A7W9DTE4_9ACTN|nr:Gfo/Idh/MocA family oxidoreductase [Sphaerisporangium krabiense]MBB5630546.1 putative dehydrogenase [Sphaerisporangium krabiense]GII62500.1 oxidoreductase [Sphaerisporangium krabiense]
MAREAVEGEDLRIGVAGFGLRGPVAVEAHRPGRGSRVVAVCDTGEAGREAARRALGPVRLTGDFADLLEPGIDAVMILTPDHTHAGLAVRALEAGKATFVEKPLAVTLEDCDRVLRTAYERRARLYVGHNMRHMPVVRVMRRLVAEGAIGEVKAVWCRHFVGDGGDYYFKDWHADRRNTGGLLLQKGAHDIDVIHWLAGSRTARVTGMGGLTVYGEITDRAPGLPQDWYDPARNWPPLAQKGLNPVVDVEDLSMMHMLLENGVYASYQQCHYTPDYWRNYTVIGTEGRLENFGDLGAGAVVRVWNAGRRAYDPEGDLTVPVVAGEGGHGGADEELVDEFVRFARAGGATDTSPVAARDSVAAALGATESLRGGSVPLDVPPLAGDLAEYFANGQF